MISELVLNNENSKIDSVDIEDLIMIMPVIYILSLIALLAGCGPNPIAEHYQASKLMGYKMQVYGSACEKLDFEKDTNAWLECIQREISRPSSNGNTMDILIGFYTTRALTIPIVDNRSLKNTQKWMRALQIFCY